MLFTVVNMIILKIYDTLQLLNVEKIYKCYALYYIQDGIGISQLIKIKNPENIVHVTGLQRFIAPKYKRYPTYDRIKY